jgi:ADP-ribose pyrophosphatase YjhB (NUDIX family)
MSSIWRPPRHIRPVAIGIVRRGAELLVVAVSADDGSVKGWRPPGGGIEPGERASTALRRELKEELGLQVSEPRLLAVIESIYEHHGTPGHEIVFAFEIEFIDTAAYAQEVFEFQDGGGIPCQAMWIDIGRFRIGEQQLFPDDLIDKL